LRIGEKHEGVVITVKEYGVYVDFGSTRDGYVRIRVRGFPCFFRHDHHLAFVRPFTFSLLWISDYYLQDFSDVDFILDAREVVRPGDKVPFYVKYVSVEEGIVTGSFVPVSGSTRC
jgi:hypothetical protein